MCLSLCLFEGTGLIELRRIEASKEIAQTLSKAHHVCVWMCDVVVVMSQLFFVLLLQSKGVIYLPSSGRTMSPL